MLGVTCQAAGSTTTFGHLSTLSSVHVMSPLCCAELCLNILMHLEAAAEKLHNAGMLVCAGLLCRDAFC